GGFLGWFLGGLDGFLYALIAFVAADYLTGVLAAIAEKRLSSSVGFTGIARKILIFTLVGLANLLDVYVLGAGAVLRTATIFFYLSNEGISLLENTTRLGLPVPAQLRETLAALTKHDLADAAPAPNANEATLAPDSQPKLPLPEPKQSTITK
ncbi:MAG: phage holin family protein, partial [Varibaculum sp.]|nr:phage holin family protein [Varibaculum sp.]